MTGADGAGAMAEPSIRTHDVAHSGVLLDALGARIAELRHSDPLAIITLVVNSASNGTMLRRQLVASGRCGAGIVGLNIQTVTDLVAALATGCGLVTGTATPLMRTAVVEALLQEDPREFEAVKDHPSTAQRLSALLAETQWCQLDPTTLSGLEGDTTSAAPVLDFLIRSRSAISDLLHEQPIGEVAATLAEMLRSDATMRAHAARRFGSVLVVAQSLPSAVHRILEVMADDSSVDVFRLANEENPRPTVVLDLPDPSTEVSVAVREAGAAIDRGTAPERIVIAYSASAPYRHLLAHELGEAGIAWNGMEHSGLDATTLGRACLLLLQMAQERAAGAAGVSRGLLMRWLGIGWIRIDGAWVSSSRLRRFIREQGLYGDSAAWETALEAFIAAAIPGETNQTGTAGGAVLADDEDDDLDPAEAQRRRRSAMTSETAAELRAVLAALAMALSPIATADTFTDIAAATWSALLSFHLDSQVWASDESERQARQRLEGLLTQEIPALDDVRHRPATAEGVARLIESDLQRRHGWHGTMGTGIHVAPVVGTVGLQFDDVIVVGAAEGILPPTAHEDPLLPDAARSPIRGTAADLALSTDGIDRCAQAYRSLVAGAARSLVTRPRGALPTGATAMPSRFLPSDSSSATRIGSRRGTLRGPAHPDLPLPVTPSDASVVAALTDPEDVDEQLRVLVASEEAALYPKFDEYHGRLGAGKSTWSLADKPISATAIETYLHCPHQFLVKRILGFSDEEPTDDVDVIEPRHFGTLIHAALEAMFRQAEAEGWLPAAGGPWPSKARAHLVAHFDAAVDEARAKGLTGWEPSWQASYALVLNTFQALLDVDAIDVRNDPALRPVAAELGFGRPGEPTVTLTLASGALVQLSGAIDRLDVSDDGVTAGVVDYKSGKSSTFKSGLNSAKKQKIQDLVYDRAVRTLLGVDEVVVTFAFVPNGGSPTAVRASDDLDRGAALTAILNTMESAAERGEFAPTPNGTEDYCAVCKRLGRRARRAAADYEASVQAASDTSPETTPDARTRTQGATAPRGESH